MVTSRAALLEEEVTYVKESLELFFADHSVTVGVDGVEEERQGSLQRPLQRRIVYEFLHTLNKLLLTDAVASTDSTQVRVPNLPIKIKHILYYISAETFACNQ